MPDGNTLRQSRKDSVAVGLHIEEATLAQASFVAGRFRLKPLHHVDRRTITESYLLMTAADSEYRLACVADYVEDSGQRIGGVVVPGMALAAEDDVRGP